MKNMYKIVLQVAENLDLFIKNESSKHNITESEVQEIIKEILLNAKKV